MRAALTGVGQAVRPWGPCRAIGPKGKVDRIGCAGLARQLPESAGPRSSRPKKRTGIGAHPCGDSRQIPRAEPAHSLTHNVKPHRELLRKRWWSRAANTTGLCQEVWNLSGYVESARGAGENLVLDGCPTGCGKHIMTNLGIPFRHIVMTSYGVEKGKAPITEELVGKVTLAVAEEVAREPGATARAP